MESALHRIAPVFVNRRSGVIATARPDEVCPCSGRTPAAFGAERAARPGRRVTNLTQSDPILALVTDERRKYVRALLRCATARVADEAVDGLHGAVSFSLSVFGVRDGCARDSTGALSCFMFYFNQLIHGETGASDGVFSFVARVRQAVTENMSLGLTLSVNEVGR